MRGVPARIKDYFSINKVLDYDASYYSQIIYVGIGIWVIYLLATAYGYSSRKDYLFPMILGIACIALVMLKLLESLNYIQLNFEDDKEKTSLRDRVGSEFGQSSRSNAEKRLYQFFMVLWLVTFPVLGYFFSVGYTTPVYVFIFIVFFTYNVRLAIIESVITAIGLYLASEYILQVQLFGF